MSVDLALEAKRQPGRNELHDVDCRGDTLVEPPLLISEGPTQSVLGHKAKSDLVGDKHDASRKTIKRPSETRGFVRNIAPRLEQVGQPQCQAIDQHACAVARMRLKRGNEIKRRLDCRPAFVAIRPVARNPRGHFIIPRLCGRQVCSGGCARLRQSLRSGALPRTRSTKDQEGLIHDTGK